MRRRKSVACAVCSEQTWNENGVCNGCLTLIEQGKRFKNLFDGDAPSMVVCRVPSEYRYMRHRFGRSRIERERAYPNAFSTLDKYVSDALFDLAGAEVMEHGETRNLKHGGASIELAGRPTTSGLSEYPFYVVVPAEQVEKLQHAMQVVADALRAAYDSGNASGEALLVNIAAGKYSVEEIEARARRERERER